MLAASVGNAQGAPPPNPFQGQQTMAGQALQVPDGPLQVNVSSAVLPDHAVIGTHMHFWSRYVYVQTGTVQVTLIDKGITQTFGPNSVIVEPIGLWHCGVVVDGPATLITVEQVPPGRENKIELPGPPGKCPQTRP
jgi:quercetin dioxygenase-like cupin family protein